MDHFIQFEDVLHICLHKIKSLILFPLSTSLIGLFVSFYWVTPVYMTQTDLLINQTTERYVTDVEMSLRLIDTYQFIMNSSSVHEKVIKALDEEDMSLKTLRKKVKIETKTGTQIISLFVKDSNLKNAQHIANTYARVAKKEIDHLMQMNNIQILTKPNTDENASPIRPQPIFYTMISFAIGLVLYMIYLCLSLYFHPKIYRPKETTSSLGVVGRAFLKKRTRKKRQQIRDVFDAILTQCQKDARTMETLRTIRTNILYQKRAQPLATLLFTSLGPNRFQEKFTQCIAMMMAMNHKKTLLIQAKRYDATDVGLTDYLYGLKELHECVTKTSVKNLHMIHFGSVPSVQSELFTSPEMDELLKQLKLTYDIILIDAPHMVQSDTTVLASKMDGTVLIGQLGKTKVALFRSVRDQLQTVHATVLGMIWIDPKRSIHPIRRIREKLGHR